jgi:hypothetical protein
VSAEPQYFPASEHDFVSVTRFEEIPPVLRRSPNLLRYVEAVQAGYSVRQLERMAERYFDEKISRERFRELQKLIPVQERIPPTYQETVLNGVDADLDVLQELKNLVAVQKVRVTEALRFESGLRKTEGGGTIPLKATADEMRLLHQMLTDYANLEVSLGLLNRTAVSPPVWGNGHGTVPDVEPLEAQIIEIRKKTTDEEYDRLLAAVEEIEAALLRQVVQAADRVAATEAVDVAVHGTGLEAADAVGVAEAIGLGVR